MKYAALVKAIHSATCQMQGRAAMAVNQALVLRNWLVGEWILEFQQHGRDRAKYGTRLLETLAADLKAKEIRGFTAAVLRQCRLFCSVYPQIRQTLSVEFPALPDSGDTVPRIRQTPSAKSPTPLSPEMRLRLSWSHLQELIAIDDPWKSPIF